MELFKLLGTIAVENAEAKEALDDTTDKAKKTGDRLDDVDDRSKKLSKGGFTILKGAAANLASAGFQKVISALGNFVKSGVEYQSQMEQYTTSFEVMTGSAEKAAEVTEKLQKLGATTPFEMTDLADATQLLMNYGFTADDAIEKMTMLGDISQGSADKMNRIAAAYGQMSSAGKVSLEDVKQMIEAGFNPLQEISESTGESMASLYDRISKGTISIDEITASMERSTSEGGKYFDSMDKQSETLSGRLSTLKDTVNNAFGSVLQPLLQKAADVWIPKLTSAVETAGEKVAAFSQWVNENSELLKVLGTVVAIVAAAIVAYNVSLHAATITTGIMTAATTAFGAVMAFVTSPITLVVLAIGALIAAGVALYKNWDTVKEKATKLWKAVTDTFNKIKDGVVSKINSAKDTVESVVDKIKGFFNFKVSLPKIKLPHFSIKPKGWELGDLLKGKIPKLGIEWYAKGGVFDKPTIFPTTSGLKGVGEAGKEAVAPISVLQTYVRDAVAAENAGITSAVDRLADMLSSYLPAILGNMGKDLVLDTGALVGGTKDMFYKEMGTITATKSRRGLK